MYLIVWIYPNKIEHPRVTGIMFWKDLIKYIINKELFITVFITMTC